AVLPMKKLLKSSLFLLFISFSLCHYAQNFRIISPKNNQSVLSNNKLVWQKYAFDFDNYVLKLSSSNKYIDTTLLKNTFYLNLLPGDYSWKVYAEKNGNYIDSTLLSAFTVYDPKGIDSLALWLVGDTGVVVSNNSVTSWYDLSDS